VEKQKAMKETEATRRKHLHHGPWCHHGQAVVGFGRGSSIASQMLCFGAYFDLLVLPMLGHFGPLLAFFFDLQGLKIIFYSYNFACKLEICKNTQNNQNDI